MLSAVVSVSNKLAPLLCRSLASCSARSNRGSSPCSPEGGLRVAAVPPHAANLTGLARDAGAMAGRDKGTGALIEPRNMDKQAIPPAPTDQAPDTVIRPWWVRTANASHPEILILPRKPPRRRWTCSRLAPGPALPDDRVKMAPGLSICRAVLRLPIRDTPDHLHHQCHRSLNSTLRTAMCSREHFSTDKATIKLLYLVLRRVSNDWKNAQREWTVP